MSERLVPQLALAAQVAAPVVVAVLVGAGRPELAVVLAVLASGAACLLALRRCRTSPSEAPTWLRLGAGAGLSTLATVIALVLYGTGVYGPVASALTPLLLLLSVPLVFCGLIRWNRRVLLHRPAAEKWIGLAALLVLLAIVDLLVVRLDLLPATHGWLLRLAVAAPVAAAVQLAGAALVLPVVCGLARDPRAWWVAVFCCCQAVALVRPVLEGGNPVWPAVVLTLGAAALMRAATRAPAPGPPTGTGAMLNTSGALGLIVLVSAVLAVADWDETPLTMGGATLGGIGCAALLWRNLRTAVALATARQHALTDQLTGFGNRAAVLAHLAELRTAGRPCALAVLDLDAFSHVNQSLGQDAGDELLTAVARRLRTRSGYGVLVARVGGDHFAVVSTTSPTSPGPTGAAELAATVAEALESPFTVAGTSVYLTASIGAADLPAGASTTTEQLLQRAETARAESRTLRIGPVVHDPDRHHDQGDDLRLLADLRTAVRTDELVLFLQPQLDVATERVVGVEALVRWQHPTRGLLAPGDFVPLAEAHGLMGLLTERVVSQSIELLAGWRSIGCGLRMAVNVSASNLLDGEFPARVRALLDDSGVEAGALTLEVTETVFIGDPDQLQDRIGELSLAGVELSIDDYGTGWSSLSYLRTLTVSEVKLDRSFTADLCSDRRSAAIVGSTIELAHQLGLRVVAEGVEDAATHLELQRLRCDLSQGYWYARPMPAEAFLSWLADREALPRLAPA